MDSISRTLYLPLYGKAWASRRGLFPEDRQTEAIWDKASSAFFIPSCLEYILQTSPGKNDNLYFAAALSTVQGSGSIGLLLAVQGRPPLSSLI